MNTSEILRSLQCLRAKTVGVFAADRIPLSMEVPIAIVCNTDDHTRPGTHWVAMYIDENREGVYFDSYGFPPVSKHHLQRLVKNCKNLRWNDRKLQSIDSTCCGQYSIMFLYHMCRGYTLQRFLQFFSRDCRKNDACVTKFHKNLLNRFKHKYMCTKTFPRERSRGYGCNQNCVSRLRI